MAELVFFAPEYLALQEEIARHPALQSRLVLNPDADAADKLALVCWYIGLELDMLFDESSQEFKQFCGKVTEELMKMRVGTLAVYTGPSRAIN